MQQKIKITYATYDDEGIDRHVSTRTVDTSVPLRKVAISVIDESIGKTRHNWLTETYDDQPIVFYLDHSDNDPLQDFGIKYGINSDGTIQFLNESAPLHHNWSLAEIYELRDSGYIKGKNDLIIATPQGLGAGAFEVSQLLAALIYIGGIYDGFAAVGVVIGFVKHRAQIKKWRKMDVRGLRQVRTLLDEKSVWTTSEIKKRLSVSEELATKILTKLGYELAGNSWRLGQSQKSLTIRGKWLAKENEIENRTPRA